MGLEQISEVRHVALRLLSLGPLGGGLLLPLELRLLGDLVEVDVELEVFGCRGLGNRLV